MTRLLLAGAAAFAVMASGAMAQTSTTETTTITTAPSVPVTTSTTNTTVRDIQADGVKTVTNRTASSDGDGKTSETAISTRTYPLSNLITTVKKSTETRDGVAYETVTTTQAYPPPSTLAPMVTTETHLVPR
jgi:hypothetical protein